MADQYIVVLKDEATARVGARAAVDELAAEYAVQVRYSYTSALRGFAARMQGSRAKRLAADPRVAYVVADSRVWATDVQSPAPSWGLDRVDQRSLPLNNAYSYSIRLGGRVFVIDTGIRVSHSDFAGRATWGFNAVDGNNTDCNGHGTHVAGTVGGNTFGVAKRVQLYAVKVLDCFGSGTASGVIAGVDWVTAHRVGGSVANMSLGGGANTALDDAVRRSIGMGVTYVVAAGNFNVDACLYSPARVSEAITVGATTSGDVRSSFSNFGTCVDLFAPGTDITSAWNSSDSAIGVLSGTSMAAPHVAGAAVLYRAGHPSATPQQVRDALVTNATSGVVADAGSGSPNKLLLAALPTFDNFFCESGGSTFTCAADWSDGTPPYTTHWYQNGTRIRAWDNRQIVSAGCTPLASITMRAVVTDSAGATDSASQWFRCSDEW